jgi:hypothetical protein
MLLGHVSYELLGELVRGALPSEFSKRGHLIL